MLSEQEFNRRLQNLDEKGKRFIEKYSMSYNLQHNKKTPACNLNSSEFDMLYKFFVGKVLPILQKLSNCIL